MVQFPVSYVSLPECNSIFLHPQTSLYLDFFVGPPFCYWSKLLTRLWRTWDLLFSATLSKNKPGDNNFASLPPISQQIKSLEKSWNMWHVLRVKIEGFCSKKNSLFEKPQMMGKTLTMIISFINSSIHGFHGLKHGEKKTPASLPVFF